MIATGGLRATRARAHEDPRDILLIDPSLFTAPYDAALSGGLESAGAQPRWAVRSLRSGEEELIGTDRSRPFFYRLTDGGQRRDGRAWRVLKGVEHALGMRRLLNMVTQEPTDLVHFQWILLPLFDARIIRRIREHCPVVVTLHDTTPFNGKAVNPLQRKGLENVLRLCDRLIVHTQTGRQTLIDAGQEPSRVAVIPHGTLASTAPVHDRSKMGGQRWRVLLIGKLQDYKGIDVLIEALGLLDEETRKRIQVTVAGEALIDLEPLRTRAAVLGLTDDSLQILEGRLSEEQFDSLIADADMFVFPYRAIEASGVLFKVASAGRWIVASALGVFPDMLGSDGESGQLVPPGDEVALAGALAASIDRTPTRDLSAKIPSWPQIGEMTREQYRQSHRSWAQERAKAA